MNDEVWKFFFNARKTVIPQRQTNCVLPVFRRYQVSDSLAVLFVCLLIPLTFRARLHFLNIYGSPTSMQLFLVICRGRLDTHSSQTQERTQPGDAFPQRHYNNAKAQT